MVVRRKVPFNVAVETCQDSQPHSVKELSDTYRPVLVLLMLQLHWEWLCQPFVAFGEKFCITGRTDDRGRTSRPRVTTARQDRRIFRSHLRQPFTPATETARDAIGTHGTQISGQTVRRRLREKNLACRRPTRGPVLTARHRQRRLQWARERMDWTSRRWQHIIFTDESRFCVSHADGHIRVGRHQNQRYQGQNVLRVDSWGGPSVMIWSGIELNRLLGPIFFQNIGGGRGNGITELCDIDETLRPVIVPYFHQHRNSRLVLQQDNARSHFAATSTFLQRNIRVLPWPSLSPDINPIEHLCDHVQRELNNLPQQPRTAAAGLVEALTQAFSQINIRIINRLVRSMPARRRAVVDARGGYTHY